MAEALALAILLAAGLFWLDSLRARERALAAGRNACRRYDVQLLDETVHCVRTRLARNDEGRLRLQRTYTFEFSETGDTRRHGSIVLLGAEVADLHLEPYALAS